MPKIVDHDAYRRDLVSRSFDVFVRLGFAACTMRVLARELGVSTGTFYHYFATKEAVFEHFVAQKAVEREAAWAAVANERPLSARTLLRTLSGQVDELRKLEVLRIEAARTMPDLRSVPRMKSLDDLCRVLDISDRALGELVYAVLVGSVLMPDPPEPAYYERVGTLLDTLIASGR